MTTARENAACWTIGFTLLALLSMCVGRKRSGKMICTSAAVRNSSVFLENVIEEGEIFIRHT